MIDRLKFIAAGIRDRETLAMLEDAVGRAELAMVNTLNIMAEEIKDRSLVEVPKSGDHIPRLRTPIALEDSVVVDHAAPGDLNADVVYDHPAAAAQEVGHMIYISPSGKEVEWEVTTYTTAGTKSHYLEDAGKSVEAQGDLELATQGHAVMTGRVSATVKAVM